MLRGVPLHPHVGILTTGRNDLNLRELLIRVPLKSVCLTRVVHGLVLGGGLPLKGGIRVAIFPRLGLRKPLRWADLLRLHHCLGFFKPLVEILLLKGKSELQRSARSCHILLLVRRWYLNLAD